jgi:hypothetical protein
MRGFAFQTSAFVSGTEQSYPSLGVAAEPVTDVGCVTRMCDLDWLQARVLHAGEESFTGPEDDRNDVKDQLVDGACCECLLDDRGAAGDVDVTAAGGSAGLLKGGGKTAGNEVERRPALHLDRIARVVVRTKTGAW